MRQSWLIADFKVRRREAARAEAATPKPTPPARAAEEWTGDLLDQFVERFRALSGEGDAKQAVENMAAFASAHKALRLDLVVMMVAFAKIGGLSRTVRALRSRVAETESRLALVEARPALKYAGAWRPDAAFAEGSLISHKGGLWLALADSVGRRPGTNEGSDSWRLVVKSGAAG
jgi:hypothetical protein